jgi:hypothetical protein
MRVRSVRPWLRLPSLVCRSALLAVALLGASCARDGRPPVYPAQGKIFYEGKPAANALVILHPVNKDPRLESVRPLAHVEADGSFKLTTFANGDGAPAGEYVVTVDWREKTAPVEGAPPGRSLLPQRYSNPESSQLRVQVKEGPNELEPLKLTR